MPFEDATRISSSLAFVWSSTIRWPNWRTSSLAPFCAARRPSSTSIMPPIAAAMANLWSADIFPDMWWPACALSFRAPPEFAFCAALDAAAAAAERWVEVSLGLVDGEVDVVVRDSGAGVPPGQEREVFRKGVTTKDPAGAGERGIGLSLVHLVCTRRGGDVTASSDGGSTFTARLPADPALVTS